MIGTSSVPAHVKSYRATLGKSIFFARFRSDRDAFDSEISAASALSCPQERAKLRR